MRRSARLLIALLLLWPASARADEVVFVDGTRQTDCTVTEETHQLVAYTIPIPGRTRPGDRLGAIPGTVPALIGTVTGCAFRDRCTHATAECAAEPPVQVDGDHAWACMRGAA